jgi:hypothetical protein
MTRRLLVGLFFEQGHRRCGLTGCTYDRPEDGASDDGTWEVLNAQANFERRPGNPKAHEESIFVPVEVAHMMELVWNMLAKALADELYTYRSRSPPSEVNFYGHWKHRSSEVAGTGGLALG